MKDATKVQGKGPRGRKRKTPECEDDGLDPPAKAARKNAV